MPACLYWKLAYKLWVVPRLEHWLLVSVGYLFFYWFLKLNLVEYMAKIRGMRVRSCCSNFSSKVGGGGCLLWKSAFKTLGLILDCTLTTNTCEQYKTNRHWVSRVRDQGCIFQLNGLFVKKYVEKFSLE